MVGRSVTESGDERAVQKCDPLRNLLEMSLPAGICPHDQTRQSALHSSLTHKVLSDLPSLLRCVSKTRSHCILCSKVKSEVCSLGS